MGCSYTQNARKKNPNKIEKDETQQKKEIKENKNSNESIKKKEEYASKKILQGIINSLISRKKYLEQKLKIPSQKDDNNIKNKKLEYPKGYQEYIDQLSIEVDKLEKKINNREIHNNSKILINFFTMTGDIYLINVNNETKLGDAFKSAFYNKQSKGGRYTINLDSGTRFSDEPSKINIEKLSFLLGGDNVSEHFRNNDPVSSLINDSNSSISILVKFPINTQYISNTKYNFNYIY
jgi:hypothetical protein